MHFFKLRLILIGWLLQGVTLAQTDNLSFLHITDLHIYLNQERYHPGIQESRRKRQYDQSEARLRQFLSTVPARTHSNLVIATGDLIDFFEAEASNGDMLHLQTEGFARLVGSYRVPMLFTLGNHDSFSFLWRDNKMLHNQNSVERARAMWIQTLGCFKEGTYYSRKYQVGKTTYRFIFLDDSFYLFQPSQDLEVPYVDKPQMQWLTTQLQESSKEVEIVFMHIPFPDNLAPAEKPNELFAVLARHPSVKLILAGHLHKHAVTKYLSGPGQALVQVQTAALTNSAENWRRVKLNEDDIQVSAPGSIENQLIISTR